MAALYFVRSYTKTLQLTGDFLSDYTEGITVLYGKMTAGYNIHVFCHRFVLSLVSSGLRGILNTNQMLF